MKIEAVPIIGNNYKVVGISRVDITSEVRINGEDWWVSTSHDKYDTLEQAVNTHQRLFKERVKEIESKSVKVRPKPKKERKIKPLTKVAS